MRKRLFALLLCLVLSLTACGQKSVETPEASPMAAETPTSTSTPTPEPIPTPEEVKELWGFPVDDTHDAFEVPTGGRLGTVLVTVEIESEEAEELQFFVWRADDFEKPLQTMTAERIWSFHWMDVRDVNFDGYVDFGYLYALGVCNQFWHYWIWNEEKGLFVAEPEFDEISLPIFDEETGIISGYARGGFAGLAGTTTFHKWIDGKLTCIRRIETYPRGGEDDPWIVTVTVEEQVDGELKTIYQEKFPGDEALSEASKWHDLNYHGE